MAVDATGRPLGPALAWLDNRAVGEAHELGGRFPSALVYDRTGVPDVNPTWPAAKMLWWRRHEPEVFGATAKFLLVEDFLLHRLTGRFVTEGGIQCTSMLFDIRTGRLVGADARCVGIGPERLPGDRRAGVSGGRADGRCRRAHWAAPQACPSWRAGWTRARVRSGSGTPARGSCPRAPAVR